MKHLVDINALTKHNIEALFEQAHYFKTAAIKTTQQLHTGRSALALFFEDSTRTMVSFQLACQRLGIDMTALNIAHSSTNKGETLHDTVLTLHRQAPTKPHSSKNDGLELGQFKWLRNQYHQCRRWHQPTPHSRPVRPVHHSPTQS